MKTKKLCIGTGRIQGLKNGIYYFNAKCYYAFDIMFSETSTLRFKNLPYIPLSYDSEEAAENEFQRIKHHFEDAKIHDGEQVAVLFDEKDGQVWAIAPLGSNLWIDTMDRFKLKIFSDLNIIITGLKVC